MAPAAAMNRRNVVLRMEPLSAGPSDRLGAKVGGGDVLGRGSANRLPTRDFQDPTARTTHLWLAWVTFGKRLRIHLVCSEPSKAGRKFCG
jgi:hypothetical protein